MEALHHIPLLSPIFTHLRNLNPKLEPGTATLLSWLSLILFIGALFHSFARGRKQFTPNQIEEFFVGEGSDITDRAGLHFETRYNDLLESVLGFGSGDIIARDQSGNVKKELHNLLWLFFRWPKLKEILEQRAATVDNAAADPAQVQDVSRVIRPVQPPTTVVTTVAPVAK